MRTLEANQFEVQRSAAGVPDKLDDYQLVIFNNWDARTIPPARKSRGGGVRQAGRRRAVDRRRAQRLRREEGRRTRTRWTAPCRPNSRPPRTPEGTCVVLIVDKSSSMEGKKIELARLAAMGVVENLRPIDSVGVLIFDNSFQWAVPIRSAEDKATHQAPDRRHHAGRRHADRARAHGGLPPHPAAARRLQAHRAAHGRHFRGGRQHGAGARGDRQPRHHLDRRAGAGRQPRVPGEGCLLRAGQGVFPQRPVGPRADPAARRAGAHRLHGGGEDDPSRRW